MYCPPHRVLKWNTSKRCLKQTVANSRDAVSPHRFSPLSPFMCTGLSMDFFLFSEIYLVILFFKNSS